MTGIHGLTTTSSYVKGGTFQRNTRRLHHKLGKKIEWNDKFLRNEVNKKKGNRILKKDVGEKNTNCLKGRNYQGHI